VLFLLALICQTLWRLFANSKTKRGALDTTARAQKQTLLAAGQPSMRLQSLRAPRSLTPLIARHQAHGAGLHLTGKVATSLLYVRARARSSPRIASKKTTLKKKRCLKKE